MTIAAIVPGFTEPLRVDRVLNDPGQGRTVGPYPSGSWFYGYVENQFDPYPRVLVFGENASDAYEWLICDPSIEEACRVSPDDLYFCRDYGPREIADKWSARWVSGIGLPAFDPANPEHVADRDATVQYAEEAGRLEWNDNGTMLDCESVHLSLILRPTIVLENV